MLSQHGATFLINELCLTAVFGVYGQKISPDCWKFSPWQEAQTHVLFIKAWSQDGFRAEWLASLLLLGMLFVA